MFSLKLKVKLARQATDLSESISSLSVFRAITFVIRFWSLRYIEQRWWRHRTRGTWTTSTWSSICVKTQRRKPMIRGRCWRSATPAMKQSTRSLLKDYGRATHIPKYVSVVWFNERETSAFIHYLLSAQDFPSKSWLIRFSDVIGASHTGDYRFWRYNGMASTGLRQVAEHGATRKLEGELKNRVREKCWKLCGLLSLGLYLGTHSRDRNIHVWSLLQSEHIRTIIKARGISYPNVTGRTFAVFRVDRKHHLMSLVSMIGRTNYMTAGIS